ncbi:MAG: 5'-methylthioadenosine/S-adenosylhomocysteine nucleosidase [Spirochaetes bacterium]|nr:5'-methylthioadenosine/S-adenosylhomocysteine nucleosidase [Spirochaetota bacterium]
MRVKKIGIIIATKIEAEPFIEGLRMRRIARKPVPLYGNGSLVLAVSGIGKTNAALGAARLIGDHHPALAVNCGAAGAAHPGLHTGEIFQIDRVYELDRPHLVHGRPMTHRPDTLKGFPCATLATQDRPVMEDDDRREACRHADLVDMEGAAIVQACRASGLPVYLFKIVSDTAGHGRKEIIERMAAVRHDLFAFFSERVLPAIT